MFGISNFGKTAFLSCNSIDVNDRFFKLGRKHFSICAKLFKGFELKFMSVTFYPQIAGNYSNLLYAKSILTKDGRSRPLIEVISFVEKFKYCKDLNFIFFTEVSLLLERSISSSEGRSDSQN